MTQMTELKQLILATLIIFSIGAGEGREGSSFQTAWFSPASGVKMAI
jgi:hypothetical protein